MSDGSRDLACAEFWEDSIARSRRRREAAERQLSFGPIDSKRIAVPAALLAGGLAVTEVVTSGGGSGGGAGVLPQDATAASATTPASKPATEPKAKRAPKAERSPKAKRTPKAKHSEAKRVAAKRAPKRKPKLVVQTVAQAQQLGGFKKGMKGPGVIQLQRELGVTADGIYGPTTLKAVHRVQKRHDLNTDGIVGPATWQAVSAPAKSSTTRPAVQRSKHKRKKHSSATVSAARLKRGGEVEALQAKLGLPVDGDYGARTTAAVKRWQRRHGLHADGVVGAATWRALGLSSSNRTLHPHHFGGNVRRHSAHRTRRHSRGGGGSRGGSGGSVVARAIAAANRIATKPYRYGGGHGSFDDTGYDCSGSVSYVLHGAGLLSSPLDSSSFMSWGAPGPGKHITIYANSGHMFMTINGRRFDTGYGGNGNRWASGSRPTAGYTVRHPPGL
jgi:peptidoglycan hydrolase-like protein with peptidoglycan-binding domain